MNLETISDQDIDELVRIDEECFERAQAYTTNFFNKLLSGNHVSRKALENKEIIGFVISLVSDGVAVIYTLDVREQHRRRGVAKQLMKSLEEDLRKRGCKEILLQTRVNNQVAINLFLKRGYWRSGRISDYYQKGVDAYEMRKTL